MQDQDKANKAPRGHLPKLSKENPTDTRFNISSKRDKQLNPTIKDKSQQLKKQGPFSRPQSLAPLKQMVERHMRQNLPLMEE